MSLIYCRNSLPLPRYNLSFALLEVKSIIWDYRKGWNYFQVLHAKYVSVNHFKCSVDIKVQTIITANSSKTYPYVSKSTQVLRSKSDSNTSAVLTRISLGKIDRGKKEQN